MFDSCKVVLKTAASDVCLLSDKNSINQLHSKMLNNFNWFANKGQVVPVDKV